MEKQGINIVTNVGHKDVILSYKLKNWTVLTSSFNNGRWITFAVFKYPKYCNKKTHEHYTEEIESQYPPQKWEVMEIRKQLKKKFDNAILPARIAYYQNILNKLQPTEAELAMVSCERCQSSQMTMIGDPEYRDIWECNECTHTQGY
jgi:hypothetical protein